MKYLIKCLKQLPMYATLAIVFETVSIALDAQILKWVAKIANNPNDYQTMNILIIGCIVSIIVDAISTRLVAIFPHGIYTTLTNMLIDKMLCADYNLYVKYSPGYLETVRQAQWKLAKVIKISIDIVSAAIRLLVNMVLIVSINKIVAIPVAIVYIINGIVIFYINKKWEEIDTKADNVEISRNKEFDQIINGYAEVRAHNTEKYHMKSLHEKNANIFQLLLLRTKYNVWITLQIDIVVNALTIGILFYLAMLLKDGIITSSVTVTLFVYIWRMINPVMCIVNSISDSSEVIVAGRKFTEVMDYVNTTSDGSINLSSFENEIRFNNVSFSYDDSDTVLKDINLVIPKGSHIGVCGTSGEGKSTLTKLIPKFYDVNTGSIEIDGIDIRRLSNKSLRSHIGIVHQEPYIFDTTIEENVRYGSMNVTHTEIVEACKCAAIYDFIMSLPEKFNTNVGPKGLKLSGGQKQRIAIARIFLTNPDIIILDEATSGLDNETETIVQESLNLFKDKTMIVVAHRLSTIRESDKIVVLNNHTIAESGTHDELLKLNGVYSKLQK